MHSTLRNVRSGLVLSGTFIAGVLLLVGCNSDPTPITSQTSKYEVAESEESAVRTTKDAKPTMPAAPAGESSAAINAASSSRPASPTSSNAQSGSSQQPPDRGAPQKPSSSPPAALTSAPTSNDPKELLTYMQELMARQPRGATNAERIARYQETQQEIIQVADRILGSQADDATSLAAAEGKIDAWSKLGQLGHPEARQELQAFLAQLTKSKNPQIVRLGRRMMFAQRMASYDATNEADTKKLLTEFHDLFNSEEKDESLFMLGTEVARAFMQSGKNTEALEVMKTTHAAFLDQKDVRLAAQVRSLGEEIRFVELDINMRVRDFVEGAPNSEKALLDTLDKLFADKEAGPTTLQIAMQLLPLLESRSMDAAAHVHDQMEKSFANSSEPEIAKLVKSSLESFSKRRALIGNPFVVEGVTLKGTPFDWSKYKGKVVLVDFWATWCQPCLQEMPNIRQNYEKYRDQGFEVVGVNIDEEPESVERFFSQQELAWETVRSPDPEKSGFEHPLLVKSGAEGIPFLVLVGRDGNVIALNPRGEQLAKKLAELFPSEGDKPAETQSPAKQKTSSVRATNQWQLVVDSPEDEQLGDFGASSRESDVEVTLSGLAAISSCDEEVEEKESNPYLAPADLSTKELVNFILEMQDKPRTIQLRDGFADAISDAADRILSGQASEKQQLIAIQAKFSALHQAALAGNEDAKKQRIAFAEKLKEDKREEVAAEVLLAQAEQKADEILAKAPDQINGALDELKSYFQNAKLTERHQNLASTIVESINKLANKDLREKRFKEFGDYFAKSEDKVLARYGGRLAEPAPVEPADFIGKPLALTGTTVLGAPFDWASYRGKVVIVDIWATWCGPCREQMPRLVAMHEDLAAKGFDVVGVSVDKDSAALEDYLGKNEVPWTNISGQEAFDTAKRLGVRGIPTMLLVDREGKILATAHSLDDLAPQIEKLLEKGK